MVVCVHGREDVGEWIGWRRLKKRIIIMWIGFGRGEAHRDDCCFKKHDSYVDWMLIAFHSALLLRDPSLLPQGCGCRVFISSMNCISPHLSKRILPFSPGDKIRLIR